MASERRERIEGGRRGRGKGRKRAHEYEIRSEEKGNLPRTTPVVEGGRDRREREREKGEGERKGERERKRLRGKNVVGASKMGHVYMYVVYKSYSG
jgi:hypothetical protein